MKQEESLEKANSQPLRTSDKTTFREAVRKHLETGGEHELTPAQKEYYLKLEYTDELIRRSFGKKKREHIAANICLKYDCARSTAYQLIVDAEYVFYSSAPMSKQYRIQVAMEFIEQQMQDAAISGNHVAVAMLAKVHTKYLEMYKEFTPERAPRTIIFNVQQNLIQTNKTAEKAFEEADAIIEDLKNEGDI